MQALKYMIEEFVHRTGNKVLIAHETRDTLGENNARDFLFDILNGETRKNCVYLDFLLDCRSRRLPIYRRTMLLVSMESIPSSWEFGNGVPVLHIPYAECGRKRQMVRDMGLEPGWLIDIDEPDSRRNSAPRRLVCGFPPGGDQGKTARGPRTSGSAGVSDL